MKARTFLTSFDTTGFECLIDLTDYDKRAMWASLSNQSLPNEIPLHQMLMRARLNPKRFPEIWTFQSYLTTDQLWTVAEENPQGLADLVRKEGTEVFVTPKQKAVIE